MEQEVTVETEIGGGKSALCPFGLFLTLLPLFSPVQLLNSAEHSGARQGLQ
jgi:hypothetical protein